MNNNHVDIERTFDAFVKEIGGLVLRDSLPRSPLFENADYVFHDFQIVAELKCLTEDKLDDPNYIQKINAAWQKWRKSGLVFGDTPEQIPVNILPEPCRRELVSISSRPLSRVITKANRQIRATKSALNINAYKGLLLLANDGNFALPANTMCWLVEDVLSDHFHSIDTYVLFSVNMVAKVPGTDIPCMVWMPRFRSEKEAIPQNIMDKLSEGWSSYYDKLTGRTYRRFGDGVQSKMGA